MSKNIQATFWAMAAVASLITGGLVLHHQLHAGNPLHLIPWTNASPAKFHPQPIQATQTLTPTQSVASTTPATTSSTPAVLFVYHSKPKPKSPALTLSYGDAISLYNNTRIQFNDSCQAVPGQEVMANHSTVMLDNRSNMPQAIFIAGQSHIVGPYNYLLVALNQKDLPATLNVRCNSNPNAVEITVE